MLEEFCNKFNILNEVVVFDISMEMFVVMRNVFVLWINF